MQKTSFNPMAHWNGSQWITLLGCALALLVSMTPLAVSFGIFLLPISQTFGWSRDVVSSAFAIAMFAAAFAQIAVGQIIDRYSPRRTVIIGTVLLAAATASLSLLTSSRTLLMVMLGIWGAMGAPQTPLPYVKIVSAWFNQGRGLAIGLVLLGSALGTSLMSLCAHFIISHSGWRQAFIDLGLVTILIAVPAQLLLIKWPPPKQPRESVNSDSAVGRANSAEEHEQSLAQALKTFSFWGIIAAMFLMGNVVMGLQVHMFALLKDRGFSDSAAILAVTVAGASIIAGRIVSGLSLDKFRTDFVAFAFFVSPAISLGLFSQPTGVAGAVIAAAVIGMSSGGETATAAVLSLRLFGHRAFGKIYSCVLFAFSIGCGTGPWLMGRVFEQTKSYGLSLGILAAFALIAGMTALALGALNHWSRQAETVTGQRWAKAV